MKADQQVPPVSNFVPICAIGASAGGVGALRTLFRLLPTDLDVAYVVILHMSPEHPSALAQILSSCTKMDVFEVTDSADLKPNCVYVVSPDRELVVDGDRAGRRYGRHPQWSGGRRVEWYSCHSRRWRRDLLAGAR